MPWGMRRLHYTAFCYLLDIATFQLTILMKNERKMIFLNKNCAEINFFA